MTTMGIKGYFIAACVTACFIALAIIARNWSLRDTTIDRTVGPYEVVSINSGASVTYAVRRRKHESLNLHGIASPTLNQPGGQISYGCLAVLIGYKDTGDGTIDQNAFGDITIHESKDRRLERFTPDDVFNSSGQCLQISQLTEGWAWCLPEAPKPYKNAQKAAQKAKRGLWALPDYNDYRIGEEQ
jgi:hypothetical protein